MPLKTPEILFWFHHVNVILRIDDWMIKVRNLSKREEMFSKFGARKHKYANFCGLNDSSSKRWREFLNYTNENFNVLALTWIHLFNKRKRTDNLRQMVVDSSAACAEIHDLKLRNSTENDKLTHLCPSTKTFSCEREAFNWKMCPQFHMSRINGKN